MMSSYEMKERVCNQFFNLINISYASTQPYNLKQSSKAPVLTSFSLRYNMGSDVMDETYEMNGWAMGVGHVSSA